VTGRRRCGWAGFDANLVWSEHQTRFSNSAVSAKINPSTPRRERVQGLVAYVVSGDHVRAIADFYHANATMQENGKPPRLGRSVLMADEASALARFKIVYTHPKPVVLVDGDRVVSGR
jgi:hypothetical protein